MVKSHPRISPLPGTGLSWIAVILPSTTQSATATFWARDSLGSAIYAVEDDAQQSMLATTNASPAERIAVMVGSSHNSERVILATGAATLPIRKRIWLASRGYAVMTIGGVSGTFEPPTPPSFTLRIEGLPAYSPTTSICVRSVT